MRRHKIKLKKKNSHLFCHCVVYMISICRSETRENENQQMRSMWLHVRPVNRNNRYRFVYRIARFPLYAHEKTARFLH